MNYSNVSVVFSGSLTLNRLLINRQTLRESYSRLYNVKNIAHPLCTVRLFHNIHSKYKQIYKDRILLLPSPQEATVILRKNEFVKDFTDGPIKSYESNQLGANNPIEDNRCEARCLLTPGFLAGVFDGHGGPSCSEVVSSRILQYIAASLLPPRVLKKVIKDKSQDELIETYFNSAIELPVDVKKLYNVSFKKYLKKLALTRKREDVDVKTSLEKSFMQLDDDMSMEVFESHSSAEVNQKALEVASSGTVGCVAYVNGPHLYVANVGDCRAVLGVLTDEQQWISKTVTKDHNTQNDEEVKRVRSEHPSSERSSIIRSNRLLGEIVPLRALGDYRYKWPKDTLKKVFTTLPNENAFPNNYRTPPYLTANPEVFFHRLTHKEKFLIIASDGLWDFLTPLQAVKLVGEHMQGKDFFNPPIIPKQRRKLGEINALLEQRKKSSTRKPKDKNAATHLIRHALGGTEYGVDDNKLGFSLSLPADTARDHRDDITITIVYFDSEYLSHCPV